MKKLIMILATVFAVLVFTGCDDSKNDQDSVATLKLGAVNPAVPDAGIPASGGSYTVTVASSAGWYVVSNSEGCLARKDGDNLKISVSKNSAKTSRAISFTIESVCGEAIAIWEQTQLGTSGEGGEGGGGGEGGNGGGDDDNEQEPESGDGTDIEGGEPGIDW